MSDIDETLQPRLSDCQAEMLMALQNCCSDDG